MKNFQQWLAESGFSPYNPSEGLDRLPNELAVLIYSNYGGGNWEWPEKFDKMYGSIISEWGSLQQIKDLREMFSTGKFHWMDFYAKVNLKTGEKMEGAEENYNFLMKNGWKVFAENREGRKGEGEEVYSVLYRPLTEEEYDLRSKAIVTAIKEQPSWLDAKGVEILKKYLTPQDLSTYRGLIASKKFGF